MSAGEWPVSVTAASYCDEEQPRATTVASVSYYSLSIKTRAKALAKRGKFIMIISRTYCGGRYGKKGNTTTTMASASRPIRRPGSEEPTHRRLTAPYTGTWSHAQAKVPRRWVKAAHGAAANGGQEGQRKARVRQGQRDSRASPF